MEYKKILGYINAENEISTSVIQTAVQYADKGADALFLYNYTMDESSREEFLKTLKQVAKQCDIPFIAGLYIERFEDIKKALYTGAEQVVIKQGLSPKKSVIEEGIARFGADKLLLELDAKGDFPDFEEAISFRALSGAGILLKHVAVSNRLLERIKEVDLPIIIRDSLIRNDLSELLTLEKVTAVATNYFEDKDIRKAKWSLYEKQVPVQVFASSLSFSDFKKDDAGLVPVITQDEKTGEVLMLAYMNEEAFQKTLETGKMTYWSRSRNELWCKGDTSGHVQYVKHLMIDCDSDTILAKVKQIGAACHTGNRTCFFTDLVKKDYDQTNPLTVFEEVYNVIKDRKQHPKEGSYTNYLLDKGIDKILKKCGEEATEIVIAAKNPDAEELKYEIADYLYHLMVLMVECNLDWKEVTKELSHRR